MNILQIANKGIFPPDGGNIALLNLSKAYSKLGNHVQILNMETEKHFNNVDKIENIVIKGIKTNTKISFIKIAINLFFSRIPYNAKRFYTKQFIAEIENILSSKNFDFIQFEGLYCLQYINDIKKKFKGKLIYRPHNLEYLIWERNALETKNIIKKIYFNIIAKRLKKLENKLLNKYDYILPISATDAKIFEKIGNIKPSLITPFGLELKDITKVTNQSKNYIKYIGALDWIPNQNGIIWFIDQCYPIILKSLPDVKLKIAGRNAPDWLIKKFTHQNIDFLGEIEDAKELFSYTGPFIVPLFSGSGMRVKIIEAMSYKNAVVSTKTGAEGIDFKDGKNILISDNHDNFAKHVVNLMDDNDLSENIGESAYQFVKENYDFINIANKVLKFIQ